MTALAKLNQSPCIEQLEQYNNDNAITLNTPSQTIQQYDNVVNKVTKLIPYPTIPIPKPKKEWYEANSEHISQVKKVYYNVNKDTILIKRKEYRDSYLSQKMTCSVCNNEVKIGSLSKHNRTKHHLTALAKLKLTTGSELNTGAESATDPVSSSQYEQQLSDLLSTVRETCEVCGGEYDKGALWNHKQTKRHMAAVANLNPSTALL